MHIAAKPELAHTFGEALEKACGGWFTLSSFVVGSYKDEKKLRSQGQTTLLCLATVCLFSMFVLI